MKKLIRLSFIYFILAMAGGVFYREFTKYLDFSGRTTLSFVHVHLMVLGTLLFLVLALFSTKFDLLENLRFKRFFLLYNLALPLAVTMLVVRGIVQVKGIVPSRALDASISGIAGLSHILLALSMFFLFSSLMEFADKHEKGLSGR